MTFGISTGVRSQAEEVESGGAHPDTLEGVPRQEYHAHKGGGRRWYIRYGGADVALLCADFDIIRFLNLG